MSLRGSEATKQSVYIIISYCLIHYVQYDNNLTFSTGTNPLCCNSLLFINLNAENDMLGKFTAHKIQEITLNILSRIVGEAGALGTFLVDESGFLIAESGDIDIDREALSALVAATFGATAEIARILGEDDFSRITHQGSQRNLFIGKAGEKHILIVVFGSETNLGLVKLYTEQFCDQLAKVLDFEPANVHDKVEENIDSIDKD